MCSCRFHTCTRQTPAIETWTFMLLQRQASTAAIVSNSSLGSVLIYIVNANTEIYLPLQFSILNGMCSWWAQFLGRSMVFNISHQAGRRVKLNNCSPDKCEIPPPLSATCIEVPSNILIEKRSLQLRKKKKSLSYYIVSTWVRVFTAMKYFIDEFDQNCQPP